MQVEQDDVVNSNVVFNDFVHFEEISKEQVGQSPIQLVFAKIVLEVIDELQKFVPDTSELHLAEVHDKCVA